MVSEKDKAFSRRFVRCTKSPDFGKGMVVVMKVAVRMDDITPNMDWEKFQQVKSILDEYQIKPLIGVVPDNRDEKLNMNKSGEKSRADMDKFWQYIRDLQRDGWTVAQHGYRHIYGQHKGGCFPLNNFSEFAGLKLEEQKEMLSEGRKILQSHGIETDIFMAPAHSYDKNTLCALGELGLNRITDGFGSTPYMWRGITFYPISFHLPTGLKRKHGVTTMVIHTNTMNEQEMARCREIIEKQEIICYNELLAEPAVKRPYPLHIAEYALAKLKHLLVKCR